MQGIGRQDRARRWRLGHRDWRDTKTDATEAKDGWRRSKVPKAHPEKSPWELCGGLGKSNSSGMQEVEARGPWDVIRGEERDVRQSNRKTQGRG